MCSSDLTSQQNIIPHLHTKIKMANLIVPKSYDQGNILVADDEAEHIDWLIDYLKARNFQVTFAANVAEAMSAIE